LIMKSKASNALSRGLEFSAISSTLQQFEPLTALKRYFSNPNILFLKHSAIEITIIKRYFILNNTKSKEKTD
jgi:hypothetical protein